MRVSIKQGATEYVICRGESDNEYPNGLAFNGQAVVQVRQFLRAASAKPTNRGNKVTRMQFAVEREHDSHRDAVAHAVTHGFEINAATLAAYTVHLVVQGGGETKYKFTNGQLESWGCAPVTGVTTQHTYSFVGSIFELET